MKREFDERAAVARALPPVGPEWREESGALLRGYFEELQAIRNRFPGVPPAPTAVHRRVRWYRCACRTALRS